MANLTLPEPTREAFHISGTAPKICFFHGFTGTPYELRPLANFIHDKTGRGCVGPILPGHAQNVETLNKVTHEEWIFHMALALKEAAHDEPVDIVGFSMGGLIATHMAAHYPEMVRRLVLLAPAYHLHFFSAAGVFISRMGVRHWLPQVSKLGGCDVADAEAKAKNPTLSHIPSHALLELDELRKYALTVIEQVNCPTLVVWGENDKTIHNKKGAVAIEKMPCNPKSHTLKNSRHILGLDNDRDELAELVTEFLS